METKRFISYKKIVDILIELSHFQSDAEHIANRIMKEVYPEEDPIELGGCHQCGGRGYSVLKTYNGIFRVVCGFCFGTGKLLHKKLEY